MMPKIAPPPGNSQSNLEARGAAAAENSSLSQAELLEARDAAPAKKAKRPRRSISELLGREWDQCSVWRRLIWDNRVSAGAFRYWHYLRDQMDTLGFVREYYASMRVIEAALHCKHESVTGWNEQLRDANYLSWEERGREHKFRYQVLNGFGQPMKGENMGQWELPMVYGMERRRVPPMAHTTGPLGADGVPPMAHATYIQGNEVRSKGESSREFWHVTNDIKAMQAIRKQIAAGPPGRERTERLEKVKAALRRLEDEAIGYEDQNPQTVPVTTPAGRANVANQSPPPDSPGPQFGTVEYEQLKQSL